MKTRFVKGGIIAAAFLCLWLVPASAQDIAGTPGGEFVEMVELALERQPLSMNPGDYLADSFFDVFVEIVLQEGIELSMNIPGIVDPGKPLRPLTSDQVTERIMQEMPELRAALPELEIDVGDANLVVPTAPGAAVYKWGHAGRWSRGPHRFDIQTTARVFQWIRASIYSTNIVWTVFKPGAYSTDCIYMNVHSNGGMRVELANRGPLLGTTTSGVNVAIPTEYALSDYIYTQINQVFAGRTTNGAPIVVGWVPDGGQMGQSVPAHKLMKLWNHIRVGTNVPPGTYATTGPSAVITVMAEPSPTTAN